MAFFAEKNLYSGVNPHLMSFFQTPNQSNYKGFHNDHITDMKRLLRSRLPAGYTAHSEDALNIIKQSSGQEFKRWVQRREADLSIRPPVATAAPLAMPMITEVAEPDYQVPFPDLTDTKKPLAVIISKTDGTKREPVAILELLSPTNKISQGRLDYQEKRYELLQLGLVLVEIDYLHEFDSPLPHFPQYPYDPESKPYYLAVSDPKRHDQTDVYRFGVLDSIPTIQIPLLGSDYVVMDFDQAFQFTFEQGFFEEVDYEQEPTRMETYSTHDQTRIREHLQQIQANRAH